MGAGGSSGLPRIEEESREMVEAWLGRLAQETREALETAEEVDLSDTGLSDDVLESLVDRTPATRASRVSRVDLSYNGDLRRCEATKSFEKLEFVALAHCRGLEDDALARVASTVCPNLVSLDVSACELVTDRGVVAVAEARRGALTQLNLQRCARVTDRGVRALAALCPALELLCLGHCPALTDDAVRAVAAGCAGLKWFDVLECGQLGDEAGLALAACRRLETLVLAGNPGLTDRTLAAIANTLHDLVSLNLSFCHQLSGPVLARLTASCPHLRELTLAGCAALADDDLLAIVRAQDHGDSRLQNLVLSGCTTLTDDTLRAVVTACPWLLSISVIGCDRLTQAAVAQIKAANPELQLYL